MAKREMDTESDDAGPPVEDSNGAETVVGRFRRDSESSESLDATWAELKPDPAAPHLGMRLHGYRLVEMIGRGGWSFVYRAVHERLALEFAVKILSDEASSPIASRRLLREARLMSALDHPNVAKVVDFGELENGNPFLTLELLQGPTLFELIDREAPFDPARTASYVRQIAEGLAAAHALGVVHRDLKPGNLMVVDRGGLQCVKILDFGVARSSRAEQETQLTRQSHLLGTPLYIAPEQIREPSAVTDKADVYALGVATFRMIEARLPFEGTPQEVLRKHISQEAPEASGELGPLVKQMLTKNPAERPSSEEIVAELDRLALGHEAPPTKTVMLTDLQRTTAPDVTDNQPFENGPSVLPLAPPVTAPVASTRLVWVFGALAVIGCAAGLLSLWVALQNQKPPQLPPVVVAESPEPGVSAAATARAVPTPQPPPAEPPPPTEAKRKPSRAPRMAARSAPPVSRPAAIDLGGLLKPTAMTRRSLRLDPEARSLLKAFDKSSPGSGQAAAAEALVARVVALAASEDYAKQRQRSIDARIKVMLEGGVTDELRGLEAANVKMKASRQNPPTKAWLRELAKLEAKVVR